MDTDKDRLIDRKIEELYNYLLDKPYQVLKIFNEFFGEERVDIQGIPRLEDFKYHVKSRLLKDLVIISPNSKISYDEWDSYNNLNISECPESFIVRLFNLAIITASPLSYEGFDGIFILIHFPHVRITNEYNKSTDINHLWVKVNIGVSGNLKGKFYFNKSEYTLAHFHHGYMHSHVRTIQKEDFTKFESPCTGEGPIVETISSLNVRYNEDLWNLFCLELSNYVTVESLSGVPYKKLEECSTICNYKSYINCIPISLIPHYREFNIKDFITYFIKRKKLKFNFINGSYSIGMSLPEYITLISNEFILWYNYLFNKRKVTASLADLKRIRCLEEGYIKNNKVCYKVSSYTGSYTNYIGKKVCTFKGEDITLNIIEDKYSNNLSLFLEIRTALSILYAILNILNYKYGKESNLEGNQDSTKIWYL